MTRTASLAALALAAAALALAAAAPQGAESRPASRPAVKEGSFPAKWNAGVDPNEPPVQVHAYNESFLILRQSLTTNFEAPFLYLILGEKAALLHDTGAGGIDLPGAVKPLVDAWAKRQGRSELPILVTHSHAHGDHVAGDADMAKLPGCTVVGRSPQDVQDHFRLKDWPRGSATIDLGGRVLDVIPIPGHHPAHIALYDRETRILLTGDTLYPGRLYVYDMPEYLSSVERLASFVEKNPVTWILGAHVEMTSTPFREYKVKSLARIDEHALQLAPSALDLLLEECRKMKDAPKRQVLDEFVIYPMNRR